MSDHQSVPRWATILILLCSLIEAVLILAPILGYAPARQLAYLVGAFWSPVLSAGGVYPFQPYLMFLTYGLLHGGITHLLMNMLSLAVVSRELSRFIGSGIMILIYVLTQFAAAAFFAVLEPYGGPMVGASGAIFGLAGALIAYAYKWRRKEGRAMRPIWRAVLITGGLNLAITFLLPTIAWQAHLGGFAAGLILGFVLPASRKLTGSRGESG